METMYAICAVIGGTLLVCQFVLTLFGISHHGFDGPHGDLDAGHGHDAVGHDAESSWFVGVLTFRTIVAALAFFGLGGLAASANPEFDPMVSLAIAAAAGSAALFLVAWMMRGLYRLRAEGTVRIERAVGASGTVYLSIPGRKSGAGKVTLTLQNRTVEYQAITSEDDLPTGTKVVAVAVVGPGTVEVAPVGAPERVTHA